eukprot:2722687-Rhodomonas_salina.5
MRVAAIANAKESELITVHATFGSYGRRTGTVVSARLSNLKDASQDEVHSHSTDLESSGNRGNAISAKPRMNHR